MNLDDIKKVIGIKDIILDVVPLSDNHHPASVEPCLVMIKAVGVNKVFTIHIDTYDTTSFKTKSVVQKFLNKLSNRIFCFSKRKVLHQLNVDGLHDLSLVMFMEKGDIIEQDDYDTASHLFFKNKYVNHIELNKIVPTNNHISRFVDMCEEGETYIRKQYEDAYFDLNGSIVETLQKIEANGLYVDLEQFEKHFPDKKHLIVNNKIYTEYNIFYFNG